MTFLKHAIRIRGQVQGVGFRPFIWRLATQAGITGEVWNDCEGVVINAWGAPASLTIFQQQIMTQAPPLARIDSIECSVLEESPVPTTFHIEESRDEGRRNAALTPDASICRYCLTDILNPSARHYAYPFTSCTYCGPRLSIVRAIPYDRVNTSMAPFQMCATCKAEYDDPAHRRFHAQADACPECGPQLWLENSSGSKLALTSSAQIIARAAALLQAGHILAIKGIGGIHLAVDAGNNTAVNRLRSRKLRYDKPFALMAANCESIARYASVANSDKQLLNATTAPIVLLEQYPDSEQLAEAIAPGQSRLGFMLPYSPLHTLLMQQLKRPIVLTSGNRSDEPQCIDNDDARHRLAA
ncbi:MAG: Sua5/YciO/YrdC/YwlC family protein, partial [Mariprofundus sp.]